MSKCGGICAVYECNNYKQQKESKSFFRMPKNLVALRAWIIACNRPDLSELLPLKDPDYFYNKYVVCSDHFEISCFRNKNLFSQGLLPGSIPTKNVLNVPSLIKTEPQQEVREVEVNELRIEEKPHEEFVDAVPLDVPAGISINIKLEEENKALKQVIKDYQRKLKYKSTLLWKYKKRNQILHQKVLEYKKIKSCKSYC